MLATRAGAHLSKAQDGHVDRTLNASDGQLCEIRPLQLDRTICKYSSISSSDKSSQSAVVAKRRWKHTLLAFRCLRP